MHVVERVHVAAHIADKYQLLHPLCKQTLCSFLGCDASVYVSEGSGIQPKKTKCQEKLQKKNSKQKQITKKKGPSDMCATKRVCGCRRRQALHRETRKKRRLLSQVQQGQPAMAIVM